MRRVVPLYRINGRVLYESLEGSEAAASFEPLRGIKVVLSAVDKSKSSNLSGHTEDSALVLKEPVAAVVTNHLGQYSFLVPRGSYSISVLKDTLPEGKGVAITHIAAETGIEKNYDFIVKRIHSIELLNQANDFIHLQDTYEQIHQSFSRGEIDEGKKILLYLQTMFDRDNLESRYKTSLPIKSGTTMMKEIQDYIRKRDLSDQIADTARQQLSASLPKLDQVYVSPSGYFRIHYTTEGSHAVEVNDNSKLPEYIRLVAAAFDESKAYTCGMRGFRTPKLEKAGDPFEVYVYDLKGIYGMTVASKYYSSSRYIAPAASCYIAVDNSYSGSKGFKKSMDDCIKVTAAHEFFHAVQYAYNLEADRWWKEASATWNEDEVYSNVNDYVQYLNSVFSHPEKPLEEYSYGGVLFVKLLSEYYGGYRIIKRIWELQATKYQKSISAISAAISENKRDEDIGTAFDRFTAYNFNPSQYYKEGNTWKSTPSILNTYSSYPIASTNGKLSHLSSNYLLLKISNEFENKDLKISIEPGGNSRMSFKLQKRRKTDSLCDITGISPSAEKKGMEITVRNPAGAYDEICLIPANLESSQDNMTYSFTAEFR